MQVEVPVRHAHKATRTLRCVLLKSHHQAPQTAACADPAASSGRRLAASLAFDWLGEPADDLKAHAGSLA